MQDLRSACRSGPYMSGNHDIAPPRRCSLREPHVGRPMRWPTMMQVFNVGNDRDGRLIVTVPSDQVELAARGNPDPIHPSLDHIVPVTEGGTGGLGEVPAVDQEYGRAITAGFTTADNTRLSRLCSRRFTRIIFWRSMGW